MENQLWSTSEGLLNSAVRETIMSSTSYRCSFLCYRNNILVVLIPSTKLNPNMGKHGKVFHDKFYRFYKLSYLFPRTSVASSFLLFFHLFYKFLSLKNFLSWFSTILLENHFANKVLQPQRFCVTSCLTRWQ